MPEAPARLMRRKARSFYLASRLLPYSVRPDVQVLYAYFRTVDDLADETGVVDALEAVRNIEAGLSRGRQRDGLLTKVTSVARRHGIPIKVLLEVVEGVKLDLEHTHFLRFEELHSYSDLVAGSVGAAMCYLVAEPHPEALHAARTLGIAMQLTNILRDVGEDLRADRIYIPLEEMSAFDLAMEDFRNQTMDDRFRSLMTFQIGRARRLYQEGLAGISYLHPSCRFSISAAALMYASILRKIEEMDFQVFTRRAGLSRREKLLLLPRAYALAQGIGSSRAGFKVRAA